MVAPVPRGQEAVNDTLLRDLQEWRANLSRQMAGMGFDPFRNRFAQNVLEQANQGQLLGNLMNVGSGGVQDFARQWLQARLGTDGGGSFGGQSLSRPAVAQYLQQGMANNDPSSSIYKMLNTGDWNADTEMLGAVSGLQNLGNSPLYQQAQQNFLNRWLLQARGITQDNPDLANRSPLDLFLGRSPAATPGVGPQPAAAGQQAQGLNPNLVQTPVQPGQWAPTGYPPLNPNMTQTPVAPGQWAPTGYEQSMAGQQGAPTGLQPQTPGTPPTGYGQTAAAGQQGMPAPNTYNFTPSAGRGGYLDRFGGWGEAQNLQQLMANRQGHVTAPGRASLDLGGGMMYSAPQDTARRWWGTTGAGGPTNAREPGGEAKGASGWRVFTDYLQQLMAQGQSYGQALANAFAFMERESQRSGRSLEAYGFQRSAGQ